jgi:hypothetical protein
MKDRLAASSAALALFSGAAVFAQSPPMGPEFPVAAYTTGAQRTLGVGADGDGNFTLVFESFGQDGAGNGIFARRYDASGGALGGEFQVNAYTTANQFRPAIAMNADGDFVVVWTSGGQDGHVAGVFGQRFDSAGAPQGGEFQANTYTTNYQQQPDVAIDASGDFVVVWNSFAGQDGASAGIFGRRYNASGTPQGGEFQVNTHTTSYQNFPAVAMDSTGNFAVVWQSGFQDGNLTGIYGQRFDAGGNKVGGELQVNTHTQNYQLFPDVAMHPSGSFVVAWESQQQDGAYIGVYAKRYDASGVPLEGELQVNTYTTSSQRHPRLAISPSGDVVVTWHSFGQDDPGPGLPVTETGVFAQRFDATGRRVGSELAINTYTTDLQETPAVAMDGRGGFVIAWESNDQDGASWGAFARRGGFPDARPMAVDARPSGGASNVNGVLEAGERVTVDPSYGNPSDSSVAVAGTASNLTGPGGPTYTLHDTSAGYGSIPAAGAADCLDATGDCYEAAVSGARPATHWDATFDEALTGTDLVKRWSLHVGGSFPDVAQNAFYPFIENLFHNGVTGGCAGGGYCPGTNVTRAQMAVFLLKARWGAAFVPAPATGTAFPDVPAGNPFAPWIEELVREGITAGCGSGLYCPNNPVTRQQMAVFLLKTKHGASYVPPDGVGVFGDVAPCPGTICNFIEELYNQQVTGGCQTSPLLYCPGGSVVRQQMAVFLVKTFGLRLYGP